MASPQEVTEAVELHAEHIGGIESTTVTFDAGVTILTGRNATNRTSLLQAIMAGLGSERVSLKGDEDNGEVTLRIGEETYTRQLDRRGDTVAFSGDPYLDDPELADLYAFLLESNETRRTVALNGDLRDVIMRPVDADAIEGEIRQLQSEKDDIADRIENRESLKRKLPDLEQERTDLDDEIEATREKLEAKQAELNDRSTDAEEARSEQTELENRMGELRRLESERDDIEFRIDSQRDSLSALEDERTQLQEQLDDLDEKGGAEVDTLRSEIQELRTEKQQLETEMTELQNVIQFNEEMLEGANDEISAALSDDGEEEAVTDQLLSDEDTVACWTCGTNVDRERIETTIDRLRELRQLKHGERQELSAEISERKDQVDTVESQREERNTVERRLSTVAAEIDDRQTTIETLEEKRADLTDQIAELEAEIEELEAEEHSDVLSLHREVNELELEVDRLEEKRADVSDRIADIEEQTDEIPTLEERQEQIQSQIAELRTRVERLEDDAVEGFNDHMEVVLDKLGYENIDRIWIDRTEREVREGRRKVSKSEFRLHIVRSTDDGVTYEDEFEHLSESEREVTSLVFALAGYLAHDVHETVPFILLDSVEAIDSDRIASLVEYLETYVNHLVVALLREDAQALDDSYQRITDI